jgi:hypothetical protein
MINKKIAGIAGHNYQFLRVSGKKHQKATCRDVSLGLPSDNQTWQ